MFSEQQNIIDLISIQEQDIQNRETDIYNIHSQIIEIHDIMQDLQACVAIQGFVVNNIEQSITQSNNNIDQGIELLNDSNNKLHVVHIPSITPIRANPCAIL